MQLKAGGCAHSGSLERRQKCFKQGLAQRGSKPVAGTKDRKQAKPKEQPDNLAYYLQSIATSY